MKCIFCLNEKAPSDEHVIPDSIGGRIHIKEVCRDCNSNLSQLVDAPFASCSLIELARHSHSIGGKRNKVPFPFSGVGTTESGMRVSVDRSFTPHVMRELNVNSRPDGSVDVHFSADVSDKDNFDQMLGKPLRKALALEFPTWSEEKLTEEVDKIVAAAKAQPSESDHTPIKNRWSINLDDLLFEFLKIAYEMWFRRFGYEWVEKSPTAMRLRTAILKKDSSLPIRGQLFSPEIPLPVSDPFKNHVIMEVGGACYVRLFNITCMVECEADDLRFMSHQDESRITIQNFTTGDLIEDKLPDFLMKNLPTT